MKLMPTMTFPFAPSKTNKCAPTRLLPEKSELDTPFHLKRRLSPSSEKGGVYCINVSGREEIDDSTCMRKNLDFDSNSNISLQSKDSAENMHIERDPSTHIEDLGRMQILEEKLRACVALADGQKKDMVASGAESVFDDLYDDNVIHMMDGVAMNKTFLKALYAQVLKEGAARSLEDFRVLDSKHVECVIRTVTPSADILARTIMTVEDGKIIHVGKLENAKAA